MKPEVVVGVHNCASEPIHIPGAIQSYGSLIAFDSKSLRIHYVAENAEEILGGNYLGKLVSDAFLPDVWSQISIELAKPVADRTVALPVVIGGKHLTLTFYPSANLTVIEMELDLSPEDPSFLSVYKNLNRTIQAMDRAGDFQSLCDLTARAVRELIGYERAMVYRFDANWNGTVIAEDLGADVESYLGLQYPASDIPPQARALYERNWLRYTPDVHYKSVPILSTPEKIMEPLDQGNGRLRAVSPIHIQYLKNMGVGSSASISIKKDGVLWGLIACLNPEPNPISFEVRQGMELIGKHFSLQIMTKEKSGDEAYRRELLARVEKLTLQMKKASQFVDGLSGPEETFLKLAKGSTGGSILYRGKIGHFGKTDGEKSSALLRWISENSRGPMFVTNTLEQQYPEGKELRAVSAGVVAISIPEGQPFWIALYKPEVIQTVNWGGNPEKPVEVDASGSFLSPRRSFEIWKQKVEGTSLPWSDEEIEALLDLRRTVIEVDLERQVRSALASNDELDDYARVISHDLKEPLRGIANLAKFLEEDLGEKLSGESEKNLRDISLLVGKTRTLISELYEFSKVGKVDLAFEDFDLNTAVREAEARLKPFLEENHAKIKIEGKLPVVHCDRVRITEVFVNLFTNAVKYNSSPEKKITVSADVTPAGTRISVKDNGIGIAPENRNEIFRMFKRLHSDSEFGGGTGTGLPIVKKIIERHGGRIWVTGDRTGSTFTFTLSSENV